jgi:Lon protease-like protein
MTEYILDRRRPHRLLALAVVPPSEIETMVTNHATILPIVCVGEVMHHQRESDGRYHLLINGLRRAHVSVETSRQPFRMGVLAEVSAVDDLSLVDEPRLRGNLLKWLKAIVPDEELDHSVLDLLERKERSMEMLIDLTANLILSPDDWPIRSMFLQAESLSERLELVLAQISRLIQASPSGHDGDNGPFGFGTNLLN